MKRILLLALCGILTAAFGCKPKEKFEISVYAVVGDVKIVSQTTRGAKPGEGLKLNESIVTGQASSADLLLGESGIIRLSENTTLKISALAAKSTDMDMNRGKAFVTLSKLNKAFSIKTPTAVASVRGTSFRVTADEKGARLDVLKGKVQVNPVQKGEIVKEVEKVVEVNQAVTIEAKAVDTIVKSKKLDVVALKPEEIEQIRKDIQDLKVEMTDNLNENIKQLIKEEVQEVKGAAKGDKSSELEDQKKKADELAKKAAASKAEQDRLAAAKKAEEEKAEAERREQIRKEKEKREHATNIPTL